NFERSFRHMHCDQEAKFIGRFAGLSQAGFIEPPNHARRKPDLDATTWPVLLIGQRPCVCKRSFGSFDQGGWDAILGTGAEEPSADKSPHTRRLICVNHGACKPRSRMVVHKLYQRSDTRPD